MCLFKQNIRFYMLSISKSKSKNMIILRIKQKGYDSLSDVSKINSIMSQGYVLLDVEHKSNYYFEATFSKPVFFKSAEKISIIGSKIPHYCNAKSSIVLGQIKDNDVCFINGYLMYIHTSFYTDKYKHLANNNVKKIVNDVFCKKNDAQEFITTLMPTDSKYKGSFVFYKKQFVPESQLHLLKYKKTTTPRQGDQKEINKSDLIHKSDLKIMTDNFDSVDGNIYYSYSPLFEWLLKKNNIDPTLAKSIVTKENYLNIWVNEKKDTFFNPNTIPKKFNVKIYYDNIEYKKEKIIYGTSTENVDHDADILSEPLEITEKDVNVFHFNDDDS